MMPMATRLIFALLMLTVVVGAGCRAQPTARGTPSGLRIEPLENRVDVILGQRLIIPVAIAGSRAPDVVDLDLDDGRRVRAEMYWIGVSGGAPDVSPWLPTPGRWSAVQASAASAGTLQDARTDDGWWALALDLPHDAINQSISFGGSRIPLNWYLDPAQMADAAQAGPPHPRWSDSHQVQALARADALSPVRRWRFRLLTDGLSLDAAPASPAFDDPVIEAVARQYESRWTVALGMMSLADAALADRLKRRLALVVEFPDGTGAPAWPVDDSSLASLLSDLLNTSIRADERRARCAAWLDALPPATVWIVDDAGLEDAASGETLTTAAIVNLLDRDMVASAMVSGGAQSPELRELPAMSVRMMTLAAPPASQPASPLRQITFNVGRWSAERSAVMDLVRVSPPGMRLEPLTGDWTLAGWLNGAPISYMRIPPDWSTSALLHYRASEHALEAGGTLGAESAGRWVLHLECRGDDFAAGDEVTVWIGPFGMPRSVLRVTADGAAESVQGERRMPLPGATVAEFPGRWVAQIPLPAMVIDASGELQLAVVRTDARGVRSTWPRPMLPWQTEPGRLAVDTTAWGDIVPRSELER